ncbi:hypothetical protein TNCV_4316151 [Trichonephila clavipes]|nr:hypothetical protein TNCV_4316151 [Trichonephila clavipes]
MISDGGRVVDPPLEFKRITFGEMGERISKIRDRDWILDESGFFPGLVKAPKEIYVMLVRVYEDQALCVKCEYENEYEKFLKSRKRESVSDNPRSGRLATSISDKNIERK